LNCLGFRELSIVFVGLSLDGLRFEALELVVGEFSIVNFPVGAGNLTGSLNSLVKSTVNSLVLLVRRQELLERFDCISTSSSDSMHHYKRVPDSKPYRCIVM
jgi:hypothetical protein